MKNRVCRIFIVIVVFLIITAAVFAQEAAAQEAHAAPEAGTGTGTEAAAGSSERSGLTVGLIALAAALAIGVTAIGTAMAQSRIGAAGAGTIAERPESAGTIIILVAIPETLVILGFIVSVIIVFTL